MKLYTASELAEIYQVHPKTIYKLGRQGKLKRVKVGRAVRFAEPTMERSKKNDKKSRDCEQSI